MSKSVDKSLLGKLSESIESCTGLDFTKDRESALQRAIRNATAKQGFDDPFLYCKWILEAPPGEDRLYTLIEHITVGETHFFRDKKFFHVMEERILPELIRSLWNSQRNLRIWSAGCASGEEPYSIAILLQKLIPDLSSWQLDIVGTDINREFLRKAAEGIYNQWSFRGVSKSIQRAYFHKNGDGHTILPGIKQMVKFYELNLSQEVFPCLPDIMINWNVILCRNVLMYFTPEYQQKVIDKLTMRLVEGGLLILSPAELSIVNGTSLVSDAIDGVVIYRKAGSISPVRTEPLYVQAVRTEPFFIQAVQTEPLYIQAVKTEPLYIQAAKELVDLGIQKPFPDLTDIVTDPVIATEPEKIQRSMETVYEEALALFHQGAYPDVIEMLEDSLNREELPPQTSFSAILLVARAYANQRRLDDALKWVQRVIRTDKLNTDAHYLEGIILQEKDDLKGALLSLKRALFLDPNCVLAHFAFGNLEMRRGRPKESKRHFKITLDILADYSENDILPGSENMTAGQLTEIILGMMPEEKASNG